MVAEHADKRIILGKISGFYGVKGWVKLYSYTQPKENIVSYKNVQIKLSGCWQNISLDAGKLHGKGVIAHFSGYDDRDAVAGLLGAEISVNRSQLQDNAEGEYYWADLVGLKVVNTKGIDLGQVTALIETPAHDILVVRAPESVEQKTSQRNMRIEYLIPFVVDRYIHSVDVDTGVITADWDETWV